MFDLVLNFPIGEGSFIRGFQILLLNFQTEYVSFKLQWYWSVKSWRRWKESWWQQRVTWGKQRQTDYENIDTNKMSATQEEDKMMHKIGC